MTQHFTYLVVGGGMTAHAAATGIRERDTDGTIGIVGEETTAPVARPPLSKDLWKDDEATLEGQDLDTAGSTSATLLLGRRVTAVDTDARTVTCDDGSEVSYEELLVATGGHARQLDGARPSDRVVYYRTAADYERLRAQVRPGVRAVVVGGGYIGTELAVALVGQDCEVTLVHPGDVLGGQMFPADHAATVEGLFTDAGVTVRGGREVERVEEGPDGSALEVGLDDGSTLEADVVVLGLGIEPATDFLPDAVERAEDGSVVVDDHLRTSVPHVLAAGDVATYPDQRLGRRRVEHVDHAETSGAVAGRVMAGSDEAYDHTPMFYSDLFDHWYEAVGDLDARLETVEDRFGEGSLVVFYLDDDTVRGVLLWDCDGGVDDATALVGSERPTGTQELVGRIRP